MNTLLLAALDHSLNLYRFSELLFALGALAFFLAIPVTRTFLLRTDLKAAGLFLLAVAILVFLNSCQTTENGGKLTQGQRDTLTKLELFAVDTAFNVGTEYAVTGQVNTQPLIINSLNTSSTLLHDAIASQAAANPASAQSAAQNAIVQSSTSKAVKTKVAPQVAGAIGDAINAGVPADKAVKAAASGLSKGAAKLKAKKSAKSVDV